MGANESNPYSPPKSRVDDVVPFRKTTPQPTRVYVAVVLLYAELAFDVLGDVRDMFEHPGANGMPLVFLIPATVAITGLLAWLIWKISSGAGWARFAYLPVLLCGVLWLLAEITGVFGEPVSLTVGKLIMILMPTVAIVLLFLPASNAWFRSGK